MMKSAICGPALLASAIVCSGLCLPSVGAEDSTSLLESVKIGESWYGPKLNSEDLKGRVVLIEFWGRN